MNTGEWVYLNNVKGHFGISMVKEVYDKILYSQIGEKIRDNQKCSDSIHKRLEDV
jgi:hypothetical protein